jgi:signal transduction histidine kinase
MNDSQGIARGVSRARAERLVAATRLIAHTFSVIAAGVTVRDYDSLVPLGILLPWCILSAALFWSTHRRGRLFRPPLLLALDLLVIAVVIGVTGGGASPFFAFLLITPFGAANLYGRRGMLWAGCGTLATYIAIVAVTGHHVTDPRLVIVRFGVLVLTASVIIRRADLEQQRTADLENLAAWPRVATADREAGVRMLLDHAALTLRTSGIVMTWSELDGSEYVARFERNGEFTLDEESPPPELDGGIAFSSQTAVGRFFVRAARNDDADALRLADIVARLVSAGLDQLNLVEMMRERAATDERLRLSRDLHDGLLQSLGGLALHARGARRTAASDPRGTVQQLDLIVAQLIESQRALRDFVDGLRPELLQRRDSLRLRLTRLAHTIELHWSVGIEFEVSHDLETLDIPVADEIVALVAEALTNAARHSGATRIRGFATVEEDTIRLDVEDDGRGFPFHGRYELAQLVADNHGPWSLKERVAALGGNLVIESSPRGARVEIRLPAAS